MRKLLALVAGIVLLLGHAQAQLNRTVKGKVTDEKGNPLSGVTVTIPGSDKRTLTDNGGSFSISVTDKTRYLKLTYVGYNAEEVSITGKAEVSVKLTAEDKSLAEVVVVGYGVQKKKEATGTVATVKGDVIAEKPVQSFEAALAGRAAGVQITVPTGVLNTPPVFRIRGTNSISLSSYPLIVVDGVVAYTGDFSSTSAAGNALASINPNDIESMDIAKDAAATAIYGSRAANGVVFITTKKGKTGKAKVTYDGWLGFTQAYGLPDMLNAVDYNNYKNEAVANALAIRAGSVSPANTMFALTNGPDGKPIDTKWFDYIYRQGVSHSHNVNVSGANENTNYYFSVGYTDQQGIIRKNDFKRINVLFNLESRVSKSITVGGKLSYSNEKNLAAVSSGSLGGEAYGTAGLARTGMVNAPNISPYNNDGSYNIGAQYIGPMNNVVSGNQVGFYNPVVLLDKNRSNSENNHLQSNAYLQFKPVSWLSLKSVYGIDYIFVDNEIFSTPIHGDGQGSTGSASSTYGKYKTWVWTNTAQIDQTFADKHNVNLLVGSEQQRRTSVGFGVNRQNLSDPAYTVIQAGWTLNNYTGSALGENYLLSSFARLNYNFDKKYFLSGNIRQDEYSALGVKKGTFWGVSAGWEITREKFWEKAGLDRVFSNFKIRGSYGKVGNIAGIGDYTTLSTFGSGLYGGAATLGFGSAGNPSITWETSKKTDVGVSFGLFQNKLNAEIAYYNNNIDGLVLNVPQSPSTGLGSIAQNAGKMFNKGLEVTLNASLINTKDFNWNSSFNITFNKNQVTELAPGLTEILTITGSGSTGEFPNRTIVGYPVGYFYLVRTAGVDPETGRRIFLNKAGTPVMYQHIVPTGGSNWTYADGSPAPAITQANDAVMVRNSQPKKYGGWDNTFRYKNFDLNVLLTYQLDFYVYYGTNAGLHDQRYWNNTTDVLRRWKAKGDVTDMVRPIYGDNVSYGNTIPLDMNAFNGSFMKLRNVSIGYTIPKSVLDKAKISSARFYVSAQNLAMITKYPGPDPEVASNGNSSTGQGTDRNTAPNARTITIGLNIGF